MPSEYTPQRVVCLQPSATVILAGLGCLGCIAACTKYCVDVCPKAADGRRAIVADSWTAQSEQIRTVQPDLVIAAVPYQEKAVAEILKSGARFLGLAPHTLADIYADITMLGGIMGRRQAAEALIAEMQLRIETVKRKTRSLGRLRVFCEEWGKPIIASQPWVAELVDAAGGEFVGEPAQQITVEAVAQLRPEVVVAAWCGASDRVPLEKIVRDRKWRDLPAVLEGRVYCIRDELLNTPAPTLVSGLDALASAIHPETFPQAPGLKRIRNITQPADKARRR